MIEAIETAFQQGQYPEAERLIQDLEPDNPWTKVYGAQLQEAYSQWDLAEQQYRDLLRAGYGPKIAIAARNGLARIEAHHQAAREQAIEQAIAQPENQTLGLLILEPVAPEQQQQAALHLAKVMKIDPYSARLALPSRGLRLFRSGPLGELEYYEQQLKTGGVPTFAVSLADLQAIAVYQVCYFETLTSPVQVVLHPTAQDATPVNLTFAWSDVQQRVEGQLPIFEEVVYRDARGKLKRKEQTQDHAPFCDLHLGRQNCILRIYDGAYHFHQGAVLNPAAPKNSLNQKTSWANWQNMTHLIQQQLPGQEPWSGFETFAATALDHEDILAKLPAHVNLFRRAESFWDPAFHLYSALLFHRHLRSAL